MPTSGHACRNHSAQNWAQNCAQWNSQKGGITFKKVIADMKIQFSIYRLKIQPVNLPNFWGSYQQKSHSANVSPLTTRSTALNVSASRRHNAISIISESPTTCGIRQVLPKFQGSLQSVGLSTPGIPGGLRQSTRGQPQSAMRLSRIYRALLACEHP